MLRRGRISLLLVPAHAGYIYAGSRTLFQYGLIAAPNVSRTVGHASYKVGHHAKPGRYASNKFSNRTKHGLIAVRVHTRLKKHFMGGPGTHMRDITDQATVSERWLSLEL